MKRTAVSIAAVRPDDPWLTREEAAARAGLAKQTLARLASQGAGPRFYKLNGGFCRYRLSDVDAWIESQETGGGAA